MADAPEQKVFNDLVTDVEGLRRQLDDLLIEERESSDEKLDMAFAELQEWTAGQHRVVDGLEQRSQLHLMLKDLHRALTSWRIKLDSRKDVPSSLAGTLRDLQDRVMRLIAG